MNFKKQYLIKKKNDFLTILKTINNFAVFQLKNNELTEKHKLFKLLKTNHNYFILNVNTYKKLKTPHSIFYQNIVIVYKNDKTWFSKNEMRDFLNQTDCILLSCKINNKYYAQQKLKYFLKLKKKKIFQHLFKCFSLKYKLINLIKSLHLE